MKGIYSFSQKVFEFSDGLRHHRKVSGADALAPLTPPAFYTTTPGQFLFEQPVCYTTASSIGHRQDPLSDSRLPISCSTSPVFVAKGQGFLMRGQGDNWCWTVSLSQAQKRWYSPMLALSHSLGSAYSSMPPRFRVLVQSLSLFSSTFCGK